MPKTAKLSKKERTAQVIALLKQEYPDTACSLEYVEEPWKLLVSLRLAAQCTDKRVNEIVPSLYAKFPTVAALAEAPVEEIEAIVKPCGLFHTKARDISLCMRALHNDCGDRVPDNMEDLLKLPGVGRKSANLMLGDVFGKPAIVTDTHCIRLSNRLGLVDTKDPYKVEMALWKLVPPEEGNQLCHRFVDHGRVVCLGRTKPLCDQCVLRDICPKVGL